MEIQHQSSDGFNQRVDHTKQNVGSLIECVIGVRLLIQSRVLNTQAKVIKD